MMNLREMTVKIQEMGYDVADARARVCQDIILKAIARSSLSRNVTIKGGVVLEVLQQIGVIGCGRNFTIFAAN